MKKIELLEKAIDFQNEIILQERLIKQATKDRVIWEAIGMRSESIEDGIKDHELKIYTAQKNYNNIINQLTQLENGKRKSN